MECFIPNYFFKNKYAEEIGTSYYIFGSFEDKEITVLIFDRILVILGI